MQLDTGEINPRLLKCSYFNSYDYPPNTKCSSRLCYDYELEFYIKCDGGIIVNDKYLPFKANEINIRKPGQIVQGVIPYECFIICINIKGEEEKPNDYIFGCSAKAQPLYENPLLSALPDKLITARPDYIHSLINELYKAAQFENNLNSFKINALLYDLLLELFNHQNYEDNNPVYINKQIFQAVKYIKEHFCEDIKIADIIVKSGVSKAYFHKCFKEYTKTTPIALLISLRIEKAKILLSMTNTTISDLAFLCGYDDTIYFSYIFRKTTGLTPTQYRNNYKLL
jgi:AraC family transcriptional regulator